MRYYFKVGLAIDQLLNALLGGWPDESLSARAYRWDRDGKCGWPLRVINHIFFWQIDHCFEAYCAEQEMQHLPPEYRDNGDDI